MVKIVHIITSLGDGGAQAMLYRLLYNIDRSKYDRIEVISMSNEGKYGKLIEDLGIRVHILNINDVKSAILGILKTVKLIKNTEIIQTWMYHADLFGYISSLIYPNKKLIWGIHHSNLDKDKNKYSLLKIAKVNAILSRYVYKIVSCSTVANDVHIDYGYDGNKFVTIPNGFDITEFMPYDNAERIIKDQLKIDYDKQIICHVGRWNVLKDYETLIKSIKEIINIRRDVVFLLCGSNIDYKNEELMTLIKENGIDEKYIKLLGKRKDIPIIMSASKVMVLSSKGEAFPNVIGEAMACGTPCVVTNVGDCKYIVDKYGIVVDKQDYKGIADGVEKILSLNKEEYEKNSKLCRQKIVENFEINKIVEMYELVYKS